MENDISLHFNTKLRNKKRVQNKDDQLTPAPTFVQMSKLVMCETQIAQLWLVHLYLNSQHSK